MQKPEISSVIDTESEMIYSHLICRKTVLDWTAKGVCSLEEGCLVDLEKWVVTQRLRCLMERNHHPAVDLSDD